MYICVLSERVPSPACQQQPSSRTVTSLLPGLYWGVLRMHLFHLFLYSCILPVSVFLYTACLPLSSPRTRPRRAAALARQVKVRDWRLGYS